MKNSPESVLRHFQQLAPADRRRFEQLLGNEPGTMLARYRAGPAARRRLTDDRNRLIASLCRQQGLAPRTVADWLHVRGLVELADLSLAFPAGQLPADLPFLSRPSIERRLIAPASLRRSFLRFWRRERAGGRDTLQFVLLQAAPGLEFSLKAAGAPRRRG